MLNKIQYVVTVINPRVGVWRCSDSDMLRRLINCRIIIIIIIMKSAHPYTSYAFLFWLSDEKQRPQSRELLMQLAHTGFVSTSQVISWKDLSPKWPIMC